MSNFLVVRFWGVGEGSERFPGCFVVWCTPFVLISFVMASIRNRVWKGRGAQKLFWQCPCIRGASLGITYLTFKSWISLFWVRYGLDLDFRGSPNILTPVEKGGSDFAHYGHGDDGRDGALWCERIHPPSANQHNSLINVSQPLAFSLGHRKALTQGSGFSRKFSPRWFSV